MTSPDQNCFTHQQRHAEFAVTLGLASATAREFYKVDAFAGKILIPYLLWLAFANALNYSIWKKNPGVRSQYKLVATF